MFVPIADFMSKYRDFKPNQNKMTRTDAIEAYESTDSKENFEQWIKRNKIEIIA